MDAVPIVPPLFWAPKNTTLHELQTHDTSRATDTMMPARWTHAWKPIDWWDDRSIARSAIHGWFCLDVDADFRPRWQLPVSSRALPATGRYGAVVDGGRPWQRVHSGTSRPNDGA